MRTRGVLVIKPGSPSLQHVPEQRRVLDTFAALIAIALERLHFVTVAQDTSLKMESERLRNSLLGALSHDLRTPLTALVGLADTLSMKLAANGSPHARDSCEIREQAERTAQLVDNRHAAPPIRRPLALAPTARAPNASSRSSSPPSGSMRRSIPPRRQ